MLLLISMANTIHGRSRQFSICAATVHSYLLGRRPKLPVGCVDSAWPSEVTQRQRLEWNPAASVRGSAGGTLWYVVLIMFFFIQYQWLGRKSWQWVSAKIQDKGGSLGVDLASHVGREESRSRSAGERFVGRRTQATEGCRIQEVACFIIHECCCSWEHSVLCTELA